MDLKVMKKKFNKKNKFEEASASPELLLLLEKSESLSKTIVWWETNISEVIDELDRLDTLPQTPQIEEQIDIEQNKLRKLLRRGDMERQNLDKLEKDIKNFFLVKAIMP